MTRFRYAGWFRGGATLVAIGVLAAGLLISNAGAVAEKKEASKRYVTKQIGTVKGQVVSVEAGKLGNDVTEHEATSAEHFNTPKSITASCPAGKIAIGGGAEVVAEGGTGDPPRQVALQASVPVADPPTGPNNGWFAMASETTEAGPAWSVRAHVICATP